MDFHKSKGKEIEGAVSKGKKKGKEKANIASGKSKKKDGTIRINFSNLTVNKTVNIDMATNFKELKGQMNVAAAEIAGNKGQTDLFFHHFKYNDGKKKRVVKNQEDFSIMQ